MNISNYYWYFSSALTPRFCDEVINYANSKKEVMASCGVHVVDSPADIGTTVQNALAATSV